MIRTVVAILVAGLCAAAYSGAALDVAPVGTPPPRPAQAFELPLAGEPRIVHRFAAPSAPWGPGHRGVDLAADVAEVVRAPMSGTVTFAGTVVDRGVVTVGHDDGLRSSLEPVAWSVRAGDRVERGQPLGVVQAASGHCSPAACVHWGVRRGEAYLDPLTLVPGTRPGPIVLLPDP